MADYGNGFDPTLNYYGGSTYAPPPSFAAQQQGVKPIPGIDTPTTPTTPTPPSPTPSTSGFKNTAGGPFTGPNGIPDPKNPGFDTSGYRIGSKYNPTTGELTIPNPQTGLTGHYYVDPKTGNVTSAGGPNASANDPFGITYTANPATPPPGAPGAGITAPNLYAPFTTPPPVFKQPPPFQLPTLEEAENQPGYKFGVQQGEQALQQSAAAKGLLRTGGTLKGILDYGRNAATQNYQNVAAQDLGVYNTNLATQYQQPFDNAFTTFNAEGNQFRNNQTDIFNRYLELLKLSQQTA